jgi:hypothetical protein
MPTQLIERMASEKPAECDDLLKRFYAQRM